MTPSPAVRISPAAGPPRRRENRHVWRDRRSVAALEFAILAVPFLTFLLFIFELSYDLFTQEVLDMSLHLAIRQLQTGNAQNVKGAADFLNSYLCPDARGLLECKNVWIKIQKLPAPLPANQDFYTYTDGKIPLSGNKLNLAGYGNNSSTGSGNFCNSGPAQMILLSAVYVGPSFIGSLAPKILSSVNYTDNTLIHATLSTTGVVTESYPPTAPGTGVTPAAGC